MVYGVMNPSLVVPADGCHVPGHLDHHQNSGTDEKTVVNAFINGASSLVGVSLIIGLARGINTGSWRRGPDLRHGSRFWSSNAVQGMAGPAFILIVMLLFFLLTKASKWSPSSPVATVLAMPIMAPLADTVGIDRYSIVCAYQWGQYAMLYLAPYRPGFGNPDHVGCEVLQVGPFVWPIVCFTLVFGGIPPVARRSCSHNAANIPPYEEGVSPRGALLHVCAPAVSIDGSSKAGRCRNRAQSSFA